MTDSIRQFFAQLEASGGSAFTPAEIDAAYAELEQEAERDRGNPIRALLGEIKGCDVLARLIREDARPTTR